MKANLNSWWRGTLCAGFLALSWLGGEPAAEAAPAGGTVVKGNASITTSGSQVIINQSSSSAYLNWQSFNLSPGETTTFNQPSSSSVAWNYISDPNISSINGNINANGYVVLQNPNGFTVGGQAAITAHGLVMTTASTPNLNLSSGGTWSFDAPPPTAKIVNYGLINITGGGSAYLIASDIENSGSIHAPGGKIGLYAGQKVLVSMAPDGRGLSAEVTLPQGAVDNQGSLIADAGSIAVQAQFLNQNGLIQANSVKKVGGTIELVASDNLSLSENSVIAAHGGDKGISPGGTVLIKSDNIFSDQVGSIIDIRGGSSGGSGGGVEISAHVMGPIHSTIQGGAKAGYAGGKLLIDPIDLTSADIYAAIAASAGMSEISLQADNNIEISDLLFLSGVDQATKLSLTAGNDINFNDANDGSGIYGGIYGLNNWSLSLTALAGGIYLHGNSFILALNGDVNLTANKDISIESGSVTTYAGGNIYVTSQTGSINTGNSVNGYVFGLSDAPYYSVNTSSLLGGISTAAGGNVTLTAAKDVISYLPLQSQLADSTVEGDAGTGAFGPEAGNVTILAGGNVYGHYVLANGEGFISAGGNIGVPYKNPDGTFVKNADGSPVDQSMGFALSLMSGDWNVNAGGNIYVQAVRNPNGIFGEGNTAETQTPDYLGYHLFDYSSTASLTLNAGDSVEITGSDAPQAIGSVKSSGISMPMILPPLLKVTTGSGDFGLDTSIILFPSAYQNLTLNIGGNMYGIPSQTISTSTGSDGNQYTYRSSGDPINLVLSDSAATRWNNDTKPFGPDDRASSPSGHDNPNPLTVNVSGNLSGLNLYTTRETKITVGGNIENAGFIGQNLHANDVSSVFAGGTISFNGLYSFANLPKNAEGDPVPIVSANPFQPGIWDSVFYLALSPGAEAAVQAIDVQSVGANGLAIYLRQKGYLLFPDPLNSKDSYGYNPGFLYDASTGQLAFKGNIQEYAPNIQQAINALANKTSLSVLVADSRGIPILDANGHLQVASYEYNWGTTISALVAQSSGKSLSQGLGFQIGGPGTFNVTAESVNLGNSVGIVSYGFGSGYGPGFASLEDDCGQLGFGGAAVNVAVAGDLEMLSSRICSIDGGKVSVAVGGEINLSQGTFVFKDPSAYGIWTSGHSDVSVIAGEDINVGSGRIASFNGGDVYVESVNGDVNAGIGANIALLVYGIFLDGSGQPVTGQSFGNLRDKISLQNDPAFYGSGILAEYPTAKYQTPGASGPGNITVVTHNGNINSGIGGISQFALKGSLFGTSIVTLIAGDPDTTYAVDNTTGESGLYDQNGVFHSQGNVLLGQGGVVGGTINIDSQGKVEGLVVSQFDANINAAQSFSGTVVSGGAANFSGGGSISGTIVGIGGINTGSSSLGSVSLLSQNVSSGGATGVSTLGTSSGATASAQAAAQQSSQATDQGGTWGTDDDEKKKKKPQVRKISRVTVLLSSAASER